MKYIRYEQFLKLEGVKYTAEINKIVDFRNVKYGQVSLAGRTVGGLIKSLKRKAFIDLRSTHSRQIIYSEFNPNRWGVFFWNRQSGSLDAWVEFEYAHKE